MVSKMYAKEDAIKISTGVLVYHANYGCSIFMICRLTDDVEKLYLTPLYIDDKYNNQIHFGNVFGVNKYDLILFFGKVILEQ